MRTQRGSNLFFVGRCLARLLNLIWRRQHDLVRAVAPSFSRDPVIQVEVVGDRCFASHHRIDRGAQGESQSVKSAPIRRFCHGHCHTPRAGREEWYDFQLGRQVGAHATPQGCLRAGEVRLQRRSHAELLSQRQRDLIARQNSRLDKPRAQPHTARVLLHERNLELGFANKLAPRQDLAELHVFIVLMLRINSSASPWLSARALGL